MRTMHALAFCPRIHEVGRRLADERPKNQGGQRHGVDAGVRKCRVHLNGADLSRSERLLENHYSLTVTVALAFALPPTPVQVRV